MKLLYLIASGTIILWLAVFESKKIRPLHGWPKITFMITAGPIFIFLMILNIALSSSLFPDIMGTLASHGQEAFGRRGAPILAMLAACTLPSLGLWAWYRLLLGHVNSPLSNFPPLIKQEQLSPTNIEANKVSSSITQALFFRPKELSGRWIHDYYYITLNGIVVAALRAGEYTRIHLSQQTNEIGCFAKPSSDTKNYKFTFTRVELFERHTNFTLSSDIFAGSRIRALNSSKAQKYMAKFLYVEPGPRPAAIDKDNF